MINNYTSIRSFIKQWLIHACLYLFVTTGYQLFKYYLKLLEHGNYLWHPDGSPTTVWDYLTEVLLYRHNWFFPFIFILLVELVRVKFYRPRAFYHFLFAVLGGGIVWSAINILYFNIRLMSGYAWNTTYFLEQFAWYALIYAVVREYITQKLYRRSIRSSKALAEINALKAQVNPHFFFNTFNYVYGSAISEQAPRTARAIEMMTEMMRYTMTVMQEEWVPLADELHFVGNYIELQRLRLPEHDQILINVGLPENDEREGLIAPMLMIPLIENAFKYGISTDKDCYVRIVITRRGTVLNIAIENSIRTAGSNGLGTGLKNVLQRLKLLYGDSSFAVDDNGSRFLVSFTIPIQKI